MTGWQRAFVHTRTGKSSTSLREIYMQCSDQERQLSGEFYDLYSTGRGTGLLTPFGGVLQNAGPLAAGERWVRTKARKRPTSQAAEISGLHARLSHALAESLPNQSEVAVAVSGGVDCWLLAAILKREGYRVYGWYLETSVPGYCEREQVDRSSEALDIDYRSIRVTASDFVQCAAEFTAVTQTPIYNLHPVSKWLLAKGLRDEGVTTLVTGDAADQVMRWDWDCDLLPLTIACFQAAGVRMVAPFMTEEVIASCRQPDPDKRPIRTLARQLGVPVIAKQPTSFPLLPLPTRPRARLPSAGSGFKLACKEQTACLSYTTALLQHLLAP